MAAAIGWRESWTRRKRTPSNVDPLALSARMLIPRQDAEADRDVGAAGSLEEFGEKPRPVVDRAEVAHDELHVQLPASQQKSRCPGVIDVSADVGIVDDGDRFRRRWLRPTRDDGGDKEKKCVSRQSGRDRKHAMFQMVRDVRRLDSFVCSIIPICDFANRAVK
jgi:hypothetical protein